ncbi:hypothetical protein LCGC14_0394340 [marine sediment metagenome]|uniref:Holliday junction resolvase RuvC n=1 Tax=marine sediment metagenome TaxID=412755 RepID=A0A0F9T4J2_9ZZZZ
MNLIAFDLGKAMTGWAHAKDEIVQTGEHSFKGIEPHGALFDAFDAWLDELYDLTHPWEFALFYHIHAPGAAASVIFGGFRAFLLRFCWERDVAVDTAADSTVKKFATGRGNASKEEMMEAYLQDRKCSPLSHDEADAYWLMKYGLEKIGAKA